MFINYHLELFLISLLVCRDPLQSFSILRLTRQLLQHQKQPSHQRKRPSSRRSDKRN